MKLPQKADICLYRVVCHSSNNIIKILLKVALCTITPILLRITTYNKPFGIVNRFFLNGSSKVQLPFRSEFVTQHQIPTKSRHMLISGHIFWTSKINFHKSGILPTYYHIFFIYCVIGCPWFCIIHSKYIVESGVMHHNTHPSSNYNL
jgi:hypothetical protein